MIDTILIVEDEKNLQNIYKDVLQKQGYRVITADTGEQALNLVQTEQPDVVLLDLSLPGLSGEAVCMKIRSDFPDERIIIFADGDNVQTIVHSLNLGADDCMTKPIIPEELTARVAARLRRKHGTSNSVQQLGGLELNLDTHEVNREGKSISLTAQEFRLLEYLLENKGRVITRDMILNRIWGYAHDLETRVVDVYIGYLRKKIDSGFHRKLIRSVRGFGYIIKDS